MHPYILWLGSIFDQKTVMSSKAISPAANNWQLGLITQLCKKGFNVVTLGHHPEPIWPKGKFKMDNKQYKINREINCYTADYYNIPFIRKRSLITKYGSLFNDLIAKYGLPELVMSYNPYDHNSITSMHIKNVFQIPWICIVADMPTKQSDRAKQTEYLSNSDGNIYLSWEMYENSKSNNKFHLDGGIVNDQLTRLETDKSKKHKKSILYAGSLTRWGGINKLLEAYALINDENVELWICGPGKNDNVTRAAKSNKCIKYFGFVTKSELAEICKKASVFVNPRPRDVIGNESNFPSKLFEYFQYLKPIISTKTPGISPDYETILITAETDNPKSIANKIIEVLDWDEDKTNEYIETTLKFINQNKTWDIQSGRLIKWLTDEFNITSNKVNCAK